MQAASFSWCSTGWDDSALRALDSERTLVVAFSGAPLDQVRAPLDELRRLMPESKLLGCSTAGEIREGTLSDDGIVLGIARFEHTSLRVASAAVVEAGDSFTAGAAVAAKLTAPDLEAVFVLSDGLHVNGSRLVRGLASALPSRVIVTGGLAGDGPRFKDTWTLAESGPSSHLVTAVGLYGDRLRLGHGSRGGWDIFGPERRVTRSRDNVLYELDGKPALALYRAYLGDRADGLPATALLFPLALRAAPGQGAQTVRTILAIDEAAQSLTFAGDIPQGWFAQLMSANFDRLVQGASDAALLAARGGVGGSLTVAISCVGRRLVLGQRAEEEIDAVREVLPPGGAQVGFYSYGEISPHTNGTCDLHNQTMTLTVFGEA